MGELLGLGLTHFPPLAWPDEQMDRALRFTIDDPMIPDAVKHGKGWPEAMRAQFDEDRVAAAARHRAALVDGCARIRSELDAFAPDVVVIWGDDQYELFREDVVPPFCIVAADTLQFTPWRGVSGPVANVWAEPPDQRFEVLGHKAFGRQLAGDLLASDFDVAYAYEPRADRPFPHAIANTILFLDYHRGGFPYPIVPMTINCYGRLAIGRRGGMARFKPAGEDAPLDPPSPSPKRCIDVGRAVARSILASDKRVAVIASSSWSHAFLHDANWRLYPDVESDRAYYDAIVDGNHDRWYEATLADIEAAGQQEMLNWFCLIGAVDEAGLKREWSTFVETYVFNSNKCFATFR